jgi:sugar O-acyltransferase (sialic acid O-acetyltransferase NeuD family)
VEQIVIVGGGGFGWEVTEYVKKDIENGFLSDTSLMGIIDDQTDNALRAPIELPYLGTISDYCPEKNDRLLLAIGNPIIRRKVRERLASVNSKFISYVHSSVYVAESAKINEGVIVCAGSIINAGAILKDFSVVNVFCSIGHGAIVGKYSVLSPYCALNGNAVIGEQCFMGTRATIYPEVSMGDYCTVDSHSYVKMSVEHNKIITTRGNYTVLPKRIKAH